MIWRVCLSCLLACLTAGAAGKPNFILILADDLGYADLGCYGNEINQSPHLDRLAREGLKFTDFHANAANCSPTRAALLTGRYQQRMGIEGALGEGAKGLNEEETTMAEHLKQAGYATGMMGKWHLGYHSENGPNHHGFDEFVGHLHGATDYISHVDKYGRMDWWHNEEKVPEEGYNTSLITKHSVCFIEEHRDDPFFLFVSHSAIHFPWQTPEDEAHREEGKRYEDAKGKLGPHVPGPVQPVVRRMIEEMDASTGAILKTLERLDLAEETLVFFTSDNGGIVKMKGVPLGSRISSNEPLRGQKHGLYEGGHRVPGIAWWPGRIEPGESPETLMTMDLLPTFLALAGEKIPENLDGVNFAHVLTDQAPFGVDRTLFWRQGDSRAIRWRDWKMVSIHDSPFGLYNLADDIGERKNLAESQPEVFQRLLGELRAWEKQFD